MYIFFRDNCRGVWKATPLCMRDLDRLSTGDGFVKAVAFTASRRFAVAGEQVLDTLRLRLNADPPADPLLACRIVGKDRTS